MNEPTLLLADEPTGALDSAGAAEVLELFRRLHSDGQTILMVTHDDQRGRSGRASGVHAGRAHSRGCTAASPTSRGHEMAPVWFRLRTELRSRWRSWLPLAALAGIAAGVVLAIAAGAQRTETAIARYRAGAEVFDVWVGKGEMSAAAFARVEKLPQVAQALRSFDPAFWGRTDAGRALTFTTSEFNAPIDGPDAGHERPKFLSGRPPTRPGPTSSTPARGCREVRPPGRQPHPGSDRNATGIGEDRRDEQVPCRSRPRDGWQRTAHHLARGWNFGRGPSEDALPWISISRGFYETYGQVGLWFELTGFGSGEGTPTWTRSGPGSSG